MGARSEDIIGISAERIRWLLWVFRTLLLTPVLGFAQAPAAPLLAVTPIDLYELSAPSFSSFSERDGVPEAVSVEVQTDRDGFVWAASPLGLARYDGRRWRQPDNPALHEPAVHLMIDHDSTLWATFRNHGLASYDGNTWAIHNEANGALPSNHLRRVVETTEADGHQQLWALTWNIGVLRQEGARWTADPGNSQLPPGAVLSLARTQTLGGRERLWVGTFNEGLWYHEDAGWKPFSAGNFQPSQIEDLFTTRQNGRDELWISAYGAGLWRLTDAGLTGWSMESGDLPSNELYDIAQTRMPNGRRVTWAAARFGLVRIYENRVQIYDRRHGLPSDVVRGLGTWRSPDGVDVLWLAMEAGIARTTAGANQWKTASLIGARANGVFSTLVEPDGRGGERLWVGASGDGIGLYELGRWRYFSQASGDLPDTDVRMIVRRPDAQGIPTLWIGLRNGYLLRANEDRQFAMPPPGNKSRPFELIPTPWERHAGQAVMDMLTRIDSGHYEQWFATRQSGVYRYRDGEWTAFRPTNVAGQWRTGKLLEQLDATGRSWLWATSNQGLARFDGKQWQLYGADLGLPDLLLIGLNLIADAQGKPVLWIGSAQSGIVRVDVSDPQHPRRITNDALPPPPDPNAYSAVPDSRGRIFVCTNNGVQLLTPDPDGGYASRIFNRRDGVLNDECNTNSQTVDSHDRYWTGTLGGLAVYDPDGEMPDSTQKPLRLTDVRIDDVAVDATNVQVPPGQHELRVEYALLSWQRENESRFRSMLQGYDAAFGAWSTQNYRDWNGLPAGDYELHIEARDYAGNLSTPITLPIHVIPAWWQRGWALALFVALGLFAIVALLQWRTLALNRHRLQLENQVASRTAELNNANASLLELSYSDALTGLANRRRLLETLESIPHNWPEWAGTALIFVDVDHFKDFNDQFGHPAGDEALRAVSNAMRSCAPPAAELARYSGEEFACLLFDADIETARDLAARMLASVSSWDVTVPGSQQTKRVTISAGVAALSVKTLADAHRLLRDADIALYQAKNDGRNCVRG